MRTIERYLRPEEIEGMGRAGQAAAGTLKRVLERVRVGTPTATIDRWVREDTARLGGRPSQLGFHGFPAAVCVSRNDVVCHGVPSEDEIIAEGDIVNVDVTTCLNGFHGDTSATLCVGRVSPEALHVVETAHRCREAGIATVRHGARLGDIGAAILEVARDAGCTVVESFGGHGIGRQMHAAPFVPHVGRRGTGLRLEEGMCLTIEPMVNLGDGRVRATPDGWTIRTVDGGLSAQFEHTVRVTRDGCEILTLM